MHGGHHHEQHHHHHHLHKKKPEPWAPPPARQTRLGLAPVDRGTFWLVIIPITIVVFVIGVGANWV